MVDFEVVDFEIRDQFRKIWKKCRFLWGPQTMFHIKILRYLRFNKRGQNQQKMDTHLPKSFLQVCDHFFCQHRPVFIWDFYPLKGVDFEIRD